MPLNKEQLQILKMINAGKISVEEGAQLLEAIEVGNDQNNIIQPQTIVIKVSEDGKQHSNINIPFTFVKAVWKFLPAEVQSLIDIQEINNKIAAGASGRVIEVEQVEADRKIEVYLQ